MEVINIDDSDDEGSGSNNNNTNVSLPSRSEIAAAKNNSIGENDHYEYRIILLMDHREFGQQNVRERRNYINTVEERINRWFEGTSCEILSLKAADYMFVARKISKATGQVVEERLFDLIIERKDVGDLAQCLILKSRDYKPLSFFEAQMYKLVNCGINRKIFLIEGDEDTHRWRTEGGGPASEDEKRKRRLRIKTIRLLVEHGRFNGVELVCTQFKDRSIPFLIHQMELLKKSFNVKDFAKMKTMQQHADHIKASMNDPTFQKYLELRNQPRIGDKKAMKVIRDPNENWDKFFCSPSEKNEDIKSTGDERPTFWKRSSTRRQESNAAAAAVAPPPPPAAAVAGNERGSTASNGALPIVSSSNSSVATSNGSPIGGSNPYATASGSTTATSSASSDGSPKTAGEESQGKKRSAAKKTSYKKRQKTTEKLYIRQSSSNLKPSHCTPKENVSISRNEYIPANPLHDSRNSSLVAALLNDDQKPAAKSSNGKDSVCSRQPCAVQSGATSASAEFNYMLEFSEDDIEGQVVAVPTPRSSQNTKSDVDNDSQAGSNNAHKKDSGKTSTQHIFDDYKDVLESSDDDNSVSRVEERGDMVGKSKQWQVGAKEAKSDNDVIDLIDDDDDGSGDSVIVID